jgi:membrane protease subunit HflK
LERLKNEAEAYANDIIPKARGHAARLIQEATGYRDARVARADGEVAQFSALLVQYKLAPEVTRERLFIETMEEVLGSTSKVMVDVKGDTSPLLYVPIDKLIGNATSVASATAPTTMGGQSSTSSGTSTAPTTSRTGRERNRGER